MLEDDIKTAKFWDSESMLDDETNTNGNCVTPLEPETP